MNRCQPLILLLMALLPFQAMGGEPQTDVPEEARAAVAAVDRFFAALSAGNIARAAVELDPQIIILESGGAERSAAEYLGGHAKSDAEFLKTAKHQPGHRIARASGDLAWVASDNDMVIQQDGKPVTIASAETMVLRRTGDGWKIVHIHWSSRARKP
ncbi:MAG: nuclear transport factor 2 family protein [Steroidobacteraceae bacterium]